MSTDDHDPNAKSADLPTPEELLDGRHAPRPAGPARSTDAREAPATVIPTERKKRRGCVWALLMMLIVAIGVTAAVLDIRKRSRPDPTIRAGNMFFEVQRFTVRNDAIGAFMVLTGYVKNQGTQTRALRITAALHGKNGEPLVQKTDWAGLALTDKQLRLLPKSDLEAALHAAQAVRVPPDDEVPFTVIFYQIPQGVEGCGLTVDGL